MVWSHCLIALKICELVFFRTTATKGRILKHQRIQSKLDPMQSFYSELRLFLMTAPVLFTMKRRQVTLCEHWHRIIVMRARNRLVWEHSLESAHYSAQNSLQPLLSQEEYLGLLLTCYDYRKGLDDLLLNIAGPRQPQQVFFNQEFEITITYTECISKWLNTAQ